jgi:hypothetical protein
VAWLEVIGWTGSVLLIVAVLQTRVLRLRVLTTIAGVLLVVYNGVLQVWPMVALNMAIVAINVVLVGRLRSARQPEGYTLLEVDPRDEYLRHVLRVHEHDIRTFNPGFVYDAAAPGATAFLILRGDETAGVVLLEDAGGGVARLILDYVSPRYRDFTPAEFVYDRSGWFAEHGYHQVVAPARLRPDDPYLHRLGFEQRGDEWVRPVGPHLR